MKQAASHSLSALARQPGTVLIDAQTARHGWQQSRLFHSPSEYLVAWKGDEVRPVLRAAEARLAAGKWIAGFLAYEAAAAFGLDVQEPVFGVPLVWLGVYEQSSVPPPLDESPTGGFPEVRGTAFNVTGAEYERNVEQLRELIASGDTYQVNYTCLCRFRMVPDDSFRMFARLRLAHPAPFAAYVNAGSLKILSSSPELFLRRHGDVFTARPMKGTSRRGLGAAEDQRLRRALRGSAKDRAENVMIVDLLRNDLGRISRIGTVRVPRLFTCERYRSVLQLTSTVQGRAREGVGLDEMFAAVFPCGSVTGCPKHRTMQIIREMEKEPRGIYCGAIGWAGPGGDLEFNVAIRTIVHREDACVHREGRCVMGVGSGITWASNAGQEWRETRLKSRLLHVPVRDFRLLETLALQPGGRFLYLQEHLNRLRHSARYWGLPFPARRIREALDAAATQHGDTGVVVRLLLDRRGQLETDFRPLPEPESRPRRLILREERVNSDNPLLYHKTDDRPLYDRVGAEVRKAGFFDALFRNEKGHLSEGCITNVFVLKSGGWLTPPVRDGLLPGIWRAVYLRECNAAEESLTLEDLEQAEAVVVGNSVRGAVEVSEIVDEEGRTVFRAGEDGI